MSQEPEEVCIQEFQRIFSFFNLSNHHILVCFPIYKFPSQGVPQLNSFSGIYLFICLFFNLDLGSWLLCLISSVPHTSCFVTSELFIMALWQNTVDFNERNVSTGQNKHFLHSNKEIISSSIICVVDGSWFFQRLG